jgi:hypothetical protein
MRHGYERQIGTLSYILGFQDYERSPKRREFPSSFFVFVFVFFCFLGETFKESKRPRP